MSVTKNTVGANKHSPVSFEDAMQKLETIVSDLEHGELSLEQSLVSFEDGMKLAKVCQDQLNAASGRVEKIMKDFSGDETRVPLADSSVTASGESDDI